MMACPKCGGDAKVIDTVSNFEDEEFYRKRKCTDCGHIIYTIEIEVLETKRFKPRWYANHRHNKNKQA